MNRLQRLWRHAWWDASDSQRAVPDDMAQRLAARIAASEARHSGEVRICVEAALPWGMVWQAHDASALGQAVQGRALDWFGRMRIWDTEHNNGVLIYLQLAERAIEIVADRGLSRHVPQPEWQSVVDRLGLRLREGAIEDGLTQALEEVSALLVQHHGISRDAPNANELPDLVVRA